MIICSKCQLAALERVLWPPSMATKQYRLSHLLQVRTSAVRLAPASTSPLSHHQRQQQNKLQGILPAPQALITMCARAAAHWRWPLRLQSASHLRHLLTPKWQKGWKAGKQNGTNRSTELCTTKCAGCSRCTVTMQGIVTHKA